MVLGDSLFFNSKKKNTMIYLKPVGGLCNRIRAIDSALILCQKHKQNLTILWIKDQTLNCSFEELFLIPKIEDYEFNIIEYTNESPEFYRSNWFRKIKTNDIKVNKIIENDKLHKTYSSKKYVDSLSAREMDIIFYSKIQKLIKPIFENQKTSSYISSCYRLHPIENNYTSFIPAIDISKKIKDTTDKFNNTIGVHIRKSDHKTSAKYSTTNKFIKAMHHTLKNYPETSFFLSTDNKNTKEDILSEFGDKVIVNEVDSYNRNDSSAIKDAVVDLFCLSKTKKIYGSYHSTFSQFAADLGKIEEITIK